MARTVNLGGRGPGAPALPFTRLVVGLSVLLTVLPCVLVRQSLFILIIASPVVLVYAVLVGIATGMLRRDGLASATLLAVSAAPWLLMAYLEVGAAERWSAPYIAAAIAIAATFVLPLPVEVHAQRARSPA